MTNIQKGKVSFNTAMAIVVANMIGAGVFTSLGYQAAGFQAIFPLLMLWVVGGVVALCGALSYGELAGMMPRSGGEYNYLSKIYHPAFGFLSGWVSATVGFSAPVALAAMALGRYLSSAIYGTGAGSGNVATIIALVTVIGITAIHSYNIKTGSIFQRYSTAIKVILIFGFIAGGLLLTSEPQSISIFPKKGDWTYVFGNSFAISLAFVSFAYSGWNASAYLANEIDNPRMNVPLSLLFGTLGVMLVYILLNFVFLYTIPVEVLATEQAKDFNTPLEVGHLAAERIFGGTGGRFMAVMIALLLVSSISAMIFAGPRVTQVMGEDIVFLRKLSFQNKKGIPTYAILLQSVISLILIMTASFDKVLYAIAFTLDIFTFSTVLGVFVLRFTKPQEPRPYKTWGYPVTPLIFLAATGWTMYFLFTQRTQESLVALAVVLLGVVVYFVDKAPSKNN